jgi:TonB-linked SusC/RagA family outer membrane protein
MQSQEVGVRANVKVTLKSDSELLDEVVVTALGIKKSEKTLGYAASTAKAEDLAIAKTGSLMSGLQGKMAGVQISSGGVAGTSQKVLIRGISSVSSNNPLYIVDGVPINNSRIGNTTVDYGNGANDINPEDIDNVTVLRGASATALYGARAANGVIMITTKKPQGKPSVAYDGSLTLTDVLRVPMTQNIFGEGWGSWSNEENGSWGPRLDGREHWWGSTELEEKMVKPFSYVENNIRNFYQIGTEWNNNLSLRYGDDKVGITASFGNVTSNGITPNNGDTYQRNTFSLRGYANMDKLHLDMSMNYVRKDMRRSRNIYMELLQGVSDVDFSQMKDYNDVRYNTDNYFTLYAYNPYWMVDNNYSKYQDDRFYGKVELSYDILKDLKIVGRLGGDFTNYATRTFDAKLNWSEGSYQAKGNGSANPEPGYYAKYRNNLAQIDASLLLTGNRQFGDLSVGGTFGWNLNERSYDQAGAYNEALDINGWFAYNNTTSYSIADESSWKRRLIGLLGQVELGYKDWAFLNLSARNDWSSTLPVGNNSFFYGGANVSLLLNEAIPALKKIENIDLLKIRAAIGQTGNDAGTYMTNSYYTPWSSYYTYLPINGVSGLTEYNRLPNTNLKPEITTEYELGFNTVFFKNRLNVDVAWYNRQTKNQIISATLAPETGYTSNTRNVGKLENKGIEAALNFTPIRNKDWEWNVGVTFAKNWSKVKELWDGLDEYTVPTGGYTSYRGVSYVLKVGEPIGIFKLPATAIVEDEGSPYYGYRIVNTNGYLTASTTDYDYMGSSQPDFVMGFTTSLKYKGFTLAATGNWQKGGLMYSGTSYITHFNGNSTQTVYNERDAFIYPHSVKQVSGQYVENNIPVYTYNMYAAQGNYSYNPETRKEFIVSRTYFKLRELALTYDFPKSIARKLSMQNLSVGLVGHNLFLFTPKGQNYIDPESSNYGNDIDSEFGETIGTVSTRSYGVNLKVVF